MNRLDFQKSKFSLSELQNLRIARDEGEAKMV